MQTDEIVTMLVTERDRLTRAIEALQGPTKRRGRPPGKKPPVSTFNYNAPNVPDWVKPAAAKAPAKKKRKMSAAARKAIGDATRKRWAALRKAKG